MTIQSFAKVENWERFNSSLLVEVTRPQGVFTCTGVAISPTTLLTAAHCLEGDIKQIKVFTQGHYHPENDFLKVDKFKLHPEYDPKLSAFRNDIAKINLKQKLPDSIQLTPLFKGNMIEGNLFRFGFGERNKKNIRTVVTPTFRLMNLEEGVLELNDKFSRSGDSGGPIFLEKDQKLYLVAIHSTFSFGPEGEYSLNPRLASYSSWIFEN